MAGSRIRGDRKEERPEIFDPNEEVSKKNEKIKSPTR